MKQHFISDRIQNLAPSATIAMAQQVLQLKKEGKAMIDLSVGEPHFKTPDYIQTAAIKAIQSGKYFGYAPVAGYDDLKQAIAKKLAKENKIFCDADQIVVSTGAKQAIANALFTMINPGDEVIIYTPYWVSYLSLITLAEGVPIFLKGKFQNNFIPTSDQLAHAITSKTKIILYSSPANPTGAMLTKKDLENIIDIIQPYPRICVISDEIYEYLHFSSQRHISIASFQSIQDRVITVNGFSKGFAMTGWRVGYLAAAPNIAKACIKLQSQITSSSNAIAQRAALAALNGNYPSVIDQMKASYKKNQETMIHFFKKNIPAIRYNIPAGAFYLFIDISSFFGKKYQEKIIASANDFCLYILEQAQVSIVSGEAFGEKKCVRISYASDNETIVTACKKIKIALDKLL